MNINTSNKDRCFFNRFAGLFTFVRLPNHIALCTIMWLTFPRHANLKLWGWIPNTFSHFGQIFNICLIFCNIPELKFYRSWFYIPLRCREIAPSKQPPIFLNSLALNNCPFRGSTISCHPKDCNTQNKCSAVVSIPW